MNNRKGFNRLERTSSHRKALHKSMATALFRHERIRTTSAKAKEVRRTAEKLITRARTDTVHNRREVAKKIADKEILAKLFTDIALRFTNRPGGYTRILKLGKRYGDASEMVILELVQKATALSLEDNSSEESKKAKKKEETKVLSKGS